MRHRARRCSVVTRRAELPAGLDGENRHACRRRSSRRRRTSHSASTRTNGGPFAARGDGVEEGERPARRCRSSRRRPARRVLVDRVEVRAPSGSIARNDGLVPNEAISPGPRSARRSSASTARRRCRGVPARVGDEARGGEEPSAAPASAASSPVSIDASAGTGPSEAEAPSFVGPASAPGGPPSPGRSVELAPPPHAVARRATTRAARVTARCAAPRCLCRAPGAGCGPRPSRTRGP